MNLSEISANTLIRRQDSILDCDIDDGTALMSIENGEYYQLNRQASAIWQCIKTAKTFVDLIDELEKKFEVNRTDCEADVMSFLQEMQQENIIEIG